ncbi:unnamed protein product [Vitrella brassicaformis CCMP3155]|uniref:RING-type domain-containing protein n=5 Tax=Vitrella brassicaformis TaxID=1169539 RepID=A0A0G4F4U8_VITBC|nr:unnamed protein product [Vitrella brassicaformis CCMP3155]|eukprot:CEM06839.1 unnamed protein product [Vitrella brassicaformis CCMP3155]
MWHIVRLLAGAAVLPSYTIWPAAHAPVVTQAIESVTEGGGVVEAFFNATTARQRNLPALPEEADAPVFNGADNCPIGPFEACTAMQCCNTAGFVCKEKNKYYAQCRPVEEPCPPAFDPEPADWTCSFLPKPECSTPPFQPCLESQCCSTPGFHCKEKDKYYAQCRPFNEPCPPPEEPDPFSWTCAKLPRAACSSGPLDECQDTQCCDAPGYVCLRKNEVFAQCLPIEDGCPNNGTDLDATPGTTSRSPPKRARTTATTLSRNGRFLRQGGDLGMVKAMAEKDEQQDEQWDCIVLYSTAPTTALNTTDEDASDTANDTDTTSAQEDEEVAGDDGRTPLPFLCPLTNLSPPLPHPSWAASLTAHPENSLSCGDVIDASNRASTAEAVAGCGLTSGSPQILYSLSLRPWTSNPRGNINASDASISLTVSTDHLLTSFDTIIAVLADCRDSTKRAQSSGKMKAHQDRGPPIDAAGLALFSGSDKDRDATAARHREAYGSDYCVGYNDEAFESFGYLKSRLTVDVPPGNYIIVVAGYSNAIGEFRLSVECQDARIKNLETVNRPEDVMRQTDQGPGADKARQVEQDAAANATQGEAGFAISRLSVNGVGADSPSFFFQSPTSMSHDIFEVPLLQVPSSTSLSISAAAITFPKEHRTPQSVCYYVNGRAAVAHMQGEVKGQDQGSKDKGDGLSQRGVSSVTFFTPPEDGRLIKIQAMPFAGHNCTGSRGMGFDVHLEVARRTSSADGDGVVWLNQHNYQRSLVLAKETAEGDTDGGDTDTHIDKDKGSQRGWYVYYLILPIGCLVIIILPAALLWQWRSRSSALKEITSHITSRKGMLRKQPDKDHQSDPDRRRVIVLRERDVRYDDGRHERASCSSDQCRKASDCQCLTPLELQSTHSATVTPPVYRIEGKQQRHRGGQGPWGSAEGEDRDAASPSTDVEYGPQGFGMEGPAVGPHQQSSSNILDMITPSSRVDAATPSASSVTGMSGAGLLWGGSGGLPDGATSLNNRGGVSPGQLGDVVLFSTHYYVISPSQRPQHQAAFHGGAPPSTSGLSPLSRMKQSQLASPSLMPAATPPKLDRMDLASPLARSEAHDAAALRTPADSGRSTLTKVNNTFFRFNDDSSDIGSTDSRRSAANNHPRAQGQGQGQGGRPCKAAKSGSEGSEPRPQPANGGKGESDDREGSIASETEACRSPALRLQKVSSCACATCTTSRQQQEGADPSSQQQQQQQQPEGGEGGAGSPVPVGGDKDQHTDPGDHQSEVSDALYGDLSRLQRGLDKFLVEEQGFSSGISECPSRVTVQADESAKANVMPAGHDVAPRFDLERKTSRIRITWKERAMALFKRRRSGSADKPSLSNAPSVVTIARPRAATIFARATRRAIIGRPTDMTNGGGGGGGGNVNSEDVVGASTTSPPDHLPDERPDPFPSSASDVCVSMARPTAAPAVFVGPPEDGRQGSAGVDMPFCSICCSAAADVVLKPCGHGGLCIECSSEFLKEPLTTRARKRGNRRPSLPECPICREPIQEVLRIVGSVAGSEGQLLEARCVFQVVACV